MFFGETDGTTVSLSEIGQIAQSAWRDIPNNFSRVILDEFVIMPNHIHGIIVIRPEESQSRNPAIITGLPEGNAPTVVPSDKSTPPLSVIVRQYKSRVKYRCRINGLPYFQWQPRFYEHVIRNESDLNDIRNYIVNNPLKWMDDSEYVS